MSTVIYADSLLAVNFSMDFLSLFISAKLTRCAVKPLRLGLAAMIGALCALASTVASAYITLGIFEFIIAAVCACIMSLCAFGGSLTGAVRAAVTYLAVNIGLGGLMTALYSFAKKASDAIGIEPTETAPDQSPITFIFIAAVSAAVSLVYGRIRERSVTRKTVTASVTVLGSECTVTLLCDSGNLLCDPFTKKPVLILSAKCVEQTLPRELINAARTKDICVPSHKTSSAKLRLIPTDSVTGNGLLVGFVPERLVIDGSELDAVVALDTVSDGYDGCSGLVPQSLLCI